MIREHMLSMALNHSLIFGKKIFWDELCLGIRRSGNQELIWGAFDCFLFQASDKSMSLLSRLSHSFIINRQCNSPLVCSTVELRMRGSVASTPTRFCLTVCLSKSEILEGHGGPGTIRVLHFGPAIPQAEAAKERLDTVDDATKALTYTVVEGDPRYKNFTGEVEFVSTGENQTEATWTGHYDPVVDAPPPEHIKNISILMFKTFEKAIQAKTTVTYTETHTETLAASPDAIWSAVKRENSILPAALPHIFESCTFVKGNGEVGSVRVCKMGPAIPNDQELVERVHLHDESTKTVGYTVTRGDPRFKHVSAVMQYAPGPTEGTTNATWTAHFVPVAEGVSMENKFVVAVWKALEAAAKA